MNKRKTGTLYEEKAAAYLERQGYRILRKNFRCPQGEIDLVARDGNYLVFVEVKYRRNDRLGEGQYAVNFYKQRRIIQAARWYLLQNGGSEEQPCRFDVVAVNGTETVLIRDAFQC